MKEYFFTEDGIRVPFGCIPCLYFDHKTRNCPAFPEGIPEEIGTGKLHHDRVLPGQVGDFVFHMFDPPETDNPDYGAPPWFGPDFTFD